MEKRSYRKTKWGVRLSREDWIRICKERLPEEESKLLWERQEETLEITQRCLDLLVKVGLIEEVSIKLSYIV